MKYTLICTTTSGLERIRLTGMFTPIKSENDIKDLIKFIDREDVLEINCCMVQGEVVWVNDARVQLTLF